MNGGYTPYQLNKCEGVDHYYKAYEWTGEEQKWTGKYNKYVGKRRILILNEIDRIEYLIAFCLKNYYINQANMIENGNFIPKWKHEGLCKEIYNDGFHAGKEEPEVKVIVNGHRYNVI